VAVFCGIDWAEDHHDIALVDQDGTLVAKRRIGDDAAGFTTLLQLLAEAGNEPDAPIPVAIETSRGLLVAGLRATGRPVFPINPMSVSRYRDRHSVARRKSDAGDALVLANILRTGLAAHRALPPTPNWHRRSRWHVRVDLVDRTTGETETLLADYVLGCDGANSVARTAIGSGMHDLNLRGQAGHLRCSSLPGEPSRADDCDAYEGERHQDPEHQEGSQ
jgi:hypothetical protein